MMDWTSSGLAKRRPVANRSPSPELIFRMSPPGPRPVLPFSDMGVARDPAALMARARGQSAMASARRTPETQAAAQEAAGKTFSSSPHSDPFDPFKHPRIAPPQPTPHPARYVPATTRTVDTLYGDEDESSPHSEPFDPFKYRGMGPPQPMPHPARYVPATTRASRTAQTLYGDEDESSPHSEPFDPFKYRGIGPPQPMPQPARYVPATTRASRTAETFYGDEDLPPSSSSHTRAAPDSHHQSRVHPNLNFSSKETHGPSALSSGYSRESEHKGKGKEAYKHSEASTGPGHGSRSGGGAYRPHTSSKTKKFYLGKDEDEEEEDDDDDDSVYGAGGGRDEMDELRMNLAGLLGYGHKSEVAHAGGSGQQQRKWGALMDVQKHPQQEHTHVQQPHPSLTVTSKQYKHQPSHVRASKARHGHASHSSHGNSSRTRTRLRHLNQSPGHAAPTRGTHRLHAHAYPHSPDNALNNVYPHPSSSQGRSAPIPVPGAASAIVRGPYAYGYYKETERDREAARRMRP